MHSHLTHAIIRKSDGKRVMPAESVNHGLQLMDIWSYHWKEYCVKRLQYDPQPKKLLRGYGITKPGYLLIKYLADNPCSKMTDAIKHIMMELFGKLEHHDYYAFNSKTQQHDLLKQRINYGHFAYLFSPHNSNMLISGKKIYIFFF